jgi:SAM-dependent methyltransferase
VEHYAHGYHAALLSRMISDAEYYEIKAYCAARQYFCHFPTPHGRILEYGCGIGQNIAALKDAVGYDVSPEAVEECTRRGITTIAHVDDIPARHYDLVLCRHVLEHVEQPLDVLRQLLSYLGDDGTLILVLPKEKHRRVPLNVDIHRHLYCWNFRTINNLIHLAGGVPVFNASEPMFGVRTHVLLRPLLRSLGRHAYYRMARLAGYIFGDTELVIHARRRA